MAKFQRDALGPIEELYSIGLNLVLSGSKKMSEEAVEALLSTDKVHLVINDANDESRVLVDVEIEAKQFTTDSVGFGLNTRSLKFQAIAH